MRLSRIANVVRALTNSALRGVPKGSFAKHADALVLLVDHRGSARVTRWADR